MTAAPLPSGGQPKIVLDGQQRLTSLYKALSKKNGTTDGDDENRRIDVYFHLESEQFQR